MSLSLFSRRLAPLARASNAAAAAAVHARGVHAEARLAEMGIELPPVSQPPLDLFLFGCPSRVKTFMGDHLAELYLARSL